MVFSWEPALELVHSQERVMMMMMSKKSIAIFTYKHSVFSIDMKTKVVRHVPRININHLTLEDELTALEDDKINEFSA